MKIETFFKVVTVTLIVGVLVLIYGVTTMKHNYNSKKANVYVSDAEGKRKIDNNYQSERFKVIQSYTYSLNNNYAVVRVAVLRDLHNGDEYMIVRDPDAGLVVTKLSPSGH